MNDMKGRQEMLDALPAASAVLDEAGLILLVNRKWREFAESNGGDGRTYYVGRNYLQTCRSASGASSTQAALAADGVAAVIAGAPEFRCEYPCHSPTEVRWFELNVTPIPSEGARRVLVSHYNITERRIQQEEVRRAHLNANELAALVASSSDAILSYDLDGVILTWNKAAETLYGYSAEEAIGRPLDMLYPPDWPVTVAEYRDMIIQGDLTRFEVVRMTRSGEARHIAISAAPVRGPHGDVVSISNFHRDITERKAAEEHLRFVTRELTHRTKNMFAVIHAIERQTARSTDTLEAFRDKFSARLHSLMTSNDLLVSQEWRPVSLADLCRGQLAIFTGEHAERARIEGPEVMLADEAVQAIGLGLHELATNSLKYGALSDGASRGGEGEGGGGGEVLLRWSVDGEGEDQRLTLVWAERGASIRPNPARKGFGHTVVTQATAQRLDAEASLDFAPGALTWTLRVPAKHFTI